MLSANDIVQDPHWYLHGINLDEFSVLFVKTDPQALAACSFLDHRFDIRGLPSATIPLADLLRCADRIQSVTPRFVFHTAFCCSTLLARCLNVASANLSLKEPTVLMTLANYQRTQHPRLADPAQAAAIYRLVTKLLFRPFGEGQTVVVKPTNTVNNLIPHLLAIDSDSKALLLHSDLASFLLSTLKKGEQGRGFARQLFTIFRMDSPEAQQLDAIKLLRMTDSQVAAITWHLQLERFFEASERFASSQLRSLHCDRFLSDPPDILDRLVSFFDCHSLRENFAQLIDQAPLAANAKTPGETYDASDRSQEYAQAETQFADSLSVIIPWAKQLQFKYPYSEHIANPL